MSVLHSFNEEHEWRIILAVLLAIFVLLNITLTITPVLQSSRNLLLYEIKKRGIHFADEVSRLNALALGRRKLDQLDTRFLTNEGGVVSFELFDLEGHIYAPSEKLHEQIRDPFSIGARDRLIAESKKGNKESTVIKTLNDQGDTQIGIAKMISSYNVRTGLQEPVGIIAFRFQPASIIGEASNNREAYLQSLVMAAIIAIIFFCIIYYLTIRPIEELRFQTEAALKGKKRELGLKLVMEELTPLASVINNMLQKIRELSMEEGENEFNEIEEDSIYVNRLREFMLGAEGPTLIMNSAKKIEAINLTGEDLIGIRESSATGEELSDCAREKGFAATVSDLCDVSANSDGRCQKGNYEISGVAYLICVNTLIGKDGFAKAFYITFLAEE